MSLVRDRLHHGFRIPSFDLTDTGEGEFLTVLMQSSFSSSQIVLTVTNKPLDMPVHSGPITSDLVDFVVVAHMQ